MIMHAWLAPEDMLPVVDDVADDAARLPASSVPTGVAEAHDTARVGGLRAQAAADEHSMRTCC